MPPDPPTPVRLLLIGDHAMTRKVLGFFLEHQPDLTVVGDTGSAEEAFAAAVRAQPDIILLDLDWGEDNGLDVLPELQAAAPAARVIALTGVRDARMHHRAVALGAAGLVLKERAPEVLLEAIARVTTGEIWLDNLLVGNLLRELTRSPRSSPLPDPDTSGINALTAREREVITLLGQGCQTHTIAERLFISESTVRTHLTSIYEKLAVGNRLQLAIYAYRHGLASFPRNG